MHLLFRLSFYGQFYANSLNMQNNLYVPIVVKFIFFHLLQHRNFCRLVATNLKMTVVFCILHSSENRGALIPVPSLFFKFLFRAKIVTTKSEKKKARNFLYGKSFQLATESFRIFFIKIAVVAELLQKSLLTPEIRGSIPVISCLYLLSTE